LNEHLIWEAVAETLIRPKIPVKYDVCRNVVLRTVMTLVAVIETIKHAQSFLAVDWHKTVTHPCQTDTELYSLNHMNSSVMLIRYLISN